jgi:phosphatidylglycerol:prolipoprotein diacylglycerol transferase
MFPILLRIDSHIVFSYTVALVLGMAAGTWIAYRRARFRIADPAVVLDAGFWALLGGILGGRIGFVATNWAYYAEHVDKALRLSQGGLRWHGALIGGTAAVLLWGFVRRRLGMSAPDWRDLADAAAPGLALGGALGWLGCLLAGSAYGAEASGYAAPLAWLTAELPDIYGVKAVRFLTQPLMIGWCLLLWGLLQGARMRWPRGLAFVLYLLLYALADFAVAWMRGDGAWRWGLWLSQWTAAAEMCAALLVGWSLVARTGATTPFLPPDRAREEGVD